MSAKSSDSEIDPAGRQARDRLITAAGECIDRGEIGQATVGAIARAAGVHRVTFYRHFPDKESLVVEVLEHRAAPVLEHATRELSADGFFPDGLIDAMAAAIAEVRATPGLIAALGLHPSGDLPRPAGTSARFIQRANEIVGPSLVAAREAGQLRNDVPTDEIVEWLVQVCLSHLLLNPDHSIDDTRRQLNRFIVPALRKV